MFLKMKKEEYAFCARPACQKRFRKILPKQKYCHRKCAQEAALIAFANRLLEKSKEK